VLDKRGGGKADALNAGLNYCRHRFVCGVDADMVFAHDALARAMGAVVSDPAQTVGLTGFVEIAENPASALRHGAAYRLPDSKLFFAFQTLEYLRAVFNNRIAWSRLDFMLCVVGAFQLWRREILDELGGWSREFTCEDIELTFRVHRVLRERGQDYRVLCLPARIGVTEGPDTIGKLVAQRERWQRVILETWWANRRMCLNRRYGRVGMLGMPFYLVSEIVAPAFELLAIATLAVGAALGLVDWSLFALVFLLISLVNSCLSVASLLMAERQSHVYRPTGLVRLLALMPVELVLYRPLLSWARMKGSWRFLRGDKAWHKFERNVRTEPV
jgi:cellulose synthase/poly-beta-1,6-N-acetylglucosamine synthase-like glycosyltransferase